MPDVIDLTATLRVIHYASGAVEFQRRRTSLGFVLSKFEKSLVIEHLTPRRGDPVEEYLKRWRDKYERAHRYHTILDRVLDDYRLHADTGTPLRVDVGDDC